MKESTSFCEQKDVKNFAFFDVPRTVAPRSKVFLVLFRNSQAGLGMSFKNITCGVALDVSQRMDGDVFRSTCAD